MLGQSRHDQERQQLHAKVIALEDGGDDYENDDFEKEELVNIGNPQPQKEVRK